MPQPSGTPRSRHDAELERQRVADERDGMADRRDVLADRREHAADDREQRLDDLADSLRDQAHESALDVASEGDHQRAVLDRSEDRLEMSYKAIDRSRARLSRDEAGDSRAQPLAGVQDPVEQESVAPEE